MRTLFSLLSTIFILPLAAVSQERYSEGDWIVREIAGPTEKICLASPLADDALALIKRADLSAEVNWTKADTAEDDHQGPLSLRIDGNLLSLEASYGLNSAVATFPQPRELTMEILMENIAAGSTMMVEDSLGGVLAEISLEGSRGAMDALNACAEEIGATADQ